MPYDGFGARINDHYPLIPDNGYFPGTLEEPEEITVVCSCGEWEFFSQASAGGACDTAWGPDFEAHLNEESYE